MGRQPAPRGCVTPSASPATAGLHGRCRWSGQRGPVSRQALCPLGLGSALTPRAEARAIPSSGVRAPAGSRSLWAPSHPGCPLAHALAFPAWVPCLDIGPRSCLQGLTSRFSRSRRLPPFPVLHAPGWLDELGHTSLARRVRWDDSRDAGRPAVGWKPLSVQERKHESRDFSDPRSGRRDVPAQGTEPS